MKIIYIKVSNYRNIDGITVNFNQECNYIIGENNLGKSNLLSLLDTVCSGKSVDDNDFANPEKAIEVELDIIMLPNEQGFFGDNFSPENASLLKIRYQQTIKDAYPTIINIDSGESIQTRLMRKINFLKYETTSIPSKELRIDSQKGIGLLISGIIEKFTTDRESAFLNTEQVSGLMEFINEYLGKIRSFHDYSITATIAPNQTEMLTSLFYLSDGQRKLDTTGSGIQYMAMASINILCQIMELYKSKTAPFEEQLYTDDNGKKVLPLVLSIDEPEVHLHPYLQRSLISYYKKILHNKDAEFTELLKKCFDIDGIDGQIIIVTHSTDILVGDYRNLVRFFKSGDKTKVISGADPSVKFTATNEKHLIMRFPEIKEAFYAHCGLLIEGETEYGCIQAFASKVGVALDDYGICVINARGQESIKPIRQLLSAFSVPSVAIYDSDIRSNHQEIENEFFTNELCFEIEIVKNLFDNGKQSLAQEIAKTLDNQAYSMVMDENFVRKSFQKMGIDTKGYTPRKLSDVDVNDKNEFCNMYSTWFMVKKGIILGRIIGDLLPVELIPTCYGNAIKKAQEVAINV